MESTNDKIIDLIKQRLNQGNAKFGREMPIGKYKEIDVLEEILDTSIYSASLILKLIEMEEINNANSKDQRTYLET